MSTRDGIRTELARAKVNLTLHVGKALTEGAFKGYHPVDSLVVFADFGDTLEFTPSDRAQFNITGAFSDGLDGTSNNLVSQALNLTQTPSQTVKLEKHIPVSAGLGGGSANAAAVLRVFDAEHHVDATKLGADVPICRLSQTALMQGIGETVTPLPDLGQIHAVLVNPLFAVSTASIFKAFDSRPRDIFPAPNSQRGGLLQRARAGRNDLEPVAIGIAPVISSVLSEISQQPGCQLSRMSGSGASCFGVFATESAASSACQAIKQAYPNWWVKACLLGDPV